MSLILLEALALQGSPPITSLQTALQKGDEIGWQSSQLLERDGRFYAQLVIPKELRLFLDGKTELRAPLGGDRRTALQKHPREVSTLHDRIEAAKRQKARTEGIKAAKIVRAVSPMSDDELQEIIGSAFERYRRRGNIDAEPRSPEWRRTARVLAAAEYEALARVAERDEGDFTG